MTTVLIALGAWVGFCVAVLVVFVVSFWLGPHVDRFLSGEQSSFASEWREFVDRLPVAEKQHRGAA